MPPRKSLFQRFRRLDAYAQNKILDEFRVKSTTGGLVTIVSGIVILVLVFAEAARYLTPVMQPEIVVDGGKTDKLPISFNITFPRLPCYLLGLDIMDEGGDLITDYVHDVYKVRLDAEGKQIDVEKAKDLSSSPLPTSQDDTQCGSCYGARPTSGSNCCNTCDEVRKAYSDMGWMVNENDIEQCVREGLAHKMETEGKEGCNMYGQILMSRARGNFHFSPGRASSYGTQHVHDVRTYLASHHDFEHEIHYLRFGEQAGLSSFAQKRTRAQGLTNPLDNTRWGVADAGMMYQYFIKIVPTQFKFLNGVSVRTYQYSATRQERNLKQQPVGGLPGVFFMTDFSPMLILYTETRPSLASFLTGVCAIIGGIFTVASIIDGILYQASVKRKAAMGKAA